LSDSRQRFSEPIAIPRWLHRWAVLTACATFALLALGAVVTTFRVGMADPIWPTAPWYLFLISWNEPSPGFLIEHSHRLAGYVVGCCVIALALGLWRYQPRRWLGWLGVAALFGVILQGLLGGFRVRLNELVGTDLATIHGCFAQVVFALLVSLAVLTSPGWVATAKGFARQADADRAWRWSVRTAVIVLAQLVFGGLLRHTAAPVGPRGHLLLAFVVVASVTWLLRLVFDAERERHFILAVSLLAGLVFVQVIFGVEAWLTRFGTGGLPELQPVTVHQAFIRTSHFLIGSLIFATSVVAALWAHRQVAATLSLSVTPVHRLEGAA
jgi:heme A synthase